MFRLLLLLTLPLLVKTSHSVYPADNILFHYVGHIAKTEKIIDAVLPRTKTNICACRFGEEVSSRRSKRVNCLLYLASFSPGYSTVQASKQNHIISDRRVPRRVLNPDPI